MPWGFGYIRIDILEPFYFRISRTRRPVGDFVQRGIVPLTSKVHLGHFEGRQVPSP